MVYVGVKHFIRFYKLIESERFSHRCSNVKSILVTSACLYELLHLLNLSMCEESEVIKYSRRVGEKEKKW